MFKNFSWESYWTLIAFSVAFYYLVLLIIFRRTGGLNGLQLPKVVWQRQAVFSSRPEIPVEAQNSETDFKSDDFLSPPDGSDEHAVYTCVDEVNAYLEEARKQKGDKSEIVAGMRRILAKFPEVRTSSYKESVSNVIVAQCEHLCFIRLSAEDLELMWNG